MLRRCLSNLAELYGVEFQVIIVDNGSSDGTSSMVRTEYPDIHLLEKDRNFGVAGGRNMGIRYARAHLACDLFFFTDDDATLSPDALDRMRETICSDPRIGLVTPKRYVEGQAMRLGSAGGHQINLYTGVIKNIGANEIDRGQYDRERDVESAGGIVLIRAQVFDDVGLYDESFNPYGWEDVDFSLRARASGFRIRYQPLATVFHAGGKLGRGASVPLYENSKTKNYVLLMRRHATWLQKCSLVVVLPLRGIFRVAIEFMQGNRRAGAGIVSGSFRALVMILRRHR